VRRYAPLVLLFALGCSSDVQEYMPLEAGNEWQYVVRTDGDEATQAFRVAGEAPVGTLNGWLIESEMGSCRMAWDGDTLVAAELPDCSFSPPVPLLAPRGTTWNGVVTTATGKNAGSGTLSRSSEKLDVGGRQYESLKTVLTLTVSGETVQLTTWFFPRMGILRQEQRRGPALTRDRYIEHVDGP
jgi:hypothetical protein